MHKNLGIFLVYLYLLLFPLGQLLRFGFSVSLGNLQDLVAVFTIPLCFSAKCNKPDADRIAKYFLFVAAFSSILSLLWIDLVSFMYGVMYLIRIVGYYSLAITVYNLVLTKSLKRKTILKLLQLSVLVAAVIGWIQYLLLPDLTFLKYQNWDDHLNRLVGSYIDPGFTGIILLFGFILTSYYYLKERNGVYIFIAIFLLFTIMLTYSRATLLALMVSFPLMLNKNIIIKIYPFIVCLLLLIGLMLTNPRSEGTNLLRTASIKARFDNYTQTFEIFKKSPLFGVGLNNLCKVRILNYSEKPSSHSCSGSDSSLLFLMATTGGVGTFVFISFIIKIYTEILSDYKSLVMSLGVALIIHSLFVQSMFYPFVMGFMGILLGSIIRPKESK